MHHHVIVISDHPPQVEASAGHRGVDAEWLERWLTAEQKSLIWVENTGKDVNRGLSHPGRPPRSQVRSWTPGGRMRTAAPGWDRIAASNL